MGMKAFDIVLADDHEVLIEGLSALINSEENLNVSALASNGEELVKIVKQNLPHLCIVDLDMPRMNGLEASELLLKLYPDIKILILSMHKEKSLLKRIKTLGIKGYVLKTCDKCEFVFAINQILKGKTYFADEINEPFLPEEGKENHLDDSNLKPVLLSVREREVIYHLCNGLSNNQIASELHISSKTVDNHRTNIMRKLDVHNVVELVRFCIKNGLING
jgi:DNA-binding NarL/FixJ family response regulator